MQTIWGKCSALCAVLSLVAYYCIYPKNIMRFLSKSMSGTFFPNTLFYSISDSKGFSERPV